jgi:hypothetical protein
MIERIAIFPDGSKLVVEIPDDSPMLALVAEYVGKTEAEVTDGDIGIFIARSTTEALDKHLEEMSQTES